MNKKESQFQKEIKDEIRTLLPGSYVFKMEGGVGTGNPQGIPDLIVLQNNKWATLECKRDSKAARQPNQEYYIEDMNNKAYSTLIFPENKTEVYNELRKYFTS